MWVKWLQVVGYLLSVLGTCLSVITTLLPDWKHTGDETEVKFQGRVHARGLWLTCDLGCEAISVPFFRLESEVQAGRILTLLSISAGCLALTLAPFGLACTTLHSQGCVKRVLIWFAGGLMMLSGMFVGIAVSIFAKQTSDDYWESNKAPSRFPLLESRGRLVFVYGRSLYMGWLAMSVCLFSSICFFLGDAHLCAADRLITPKKEIRSTSKTNQLQNQLDSNGIDYSPQFPPPPPEIFHQNGDPSKNHLWEYEKPPPRASQPMGFPPGRMMVVNTKTGQMRPVELDPSRITNWGINGASVDPKLLEKAFNRTEESAKSSPDEPVSRVSPQREAPPPPSNSTPKASFKKKKERSPKMEKFEKKISRISMKLKPKGTGSATPITVTALPANSTNNAEKSCKKPQTITNL